MIYMKKEKKKANLKQSLFFGAVAFEFAGTG